MIMRRSLKIIRFVRVEMVCSFFGHCRGEITDTLYDITFAEITKAIDLGCRIFLFGAFSEFDDLCYQIVAKIKEEHQKLNLHRVFCVPQERYLRKRAWYFNRADYEETKYIVPAFEGWYKAIYFRNCAMIDESDYVIFYAEKRQNSGAYKTY